MLQLSHSFSRQREREEVISSSREKTEAPKSERKSNIESLNGRGG